MFGELLLNHLKRKAYIICLLIGASFLYNSFPQNVNSQFPTPTFEYLTSEDGLPENSVMCILQDYLGYLWLGTQIGLVRYDGYSMKVFQYNKNDSSSIRGRIIRTIYEDKNKTLWIGTSRGFNKFNRANDSFESYKYNPDDTNSINSGWINCIYEDNGRRFWVGTATGLNLFDRDKQIFTRYFFRDSASKLYTTSIPDKHNLSVNSIIEEPGTGDLLIGTNAAGLWRFNIKEKTLSKYKFNTLVVPDEKVGMVQSFYKSRDGKIWIASSHSISSLDPKKKEYISYIEFPLDNGINAEATVIEDQNGMIWCGFWSLDKGVFCLDPNTGNYRQYKFYPEMDEGRNYNRVYSIYEDHSGIIWAGTWLSGLQKWDKRKHKFYVLKHNPKNNNSISNTRVFAIKYDTKGFLWFLTVNGLDKYDIKTGKYKHYFKNQKNLLRIIPRFIIDKSGIIWIFGVRNHGIISFNPQKESYHFYRNSQDDSINLINKKILTVFQDKLGIIWIGTQFSGLYRYNISENKLTNYKHNPDNPSSLSENRVNVIFEDSFGTLWFGTNLGGLNRYDRKTGKFFYCALNTILAIYEDRDKNFWISDYFTGLNLFDRKENKIIATYGEKEGLSNHAIQGILEDGSGNLWMSTELGLSKFSIGKKNFKNFKKSEGLPSNRFLGVYCKDRNGIFYFHSEGGMIYFHPDSIKDDPVPPKVVISNLSLFNRPNESLNFKGFISELKQITLPYYQNDLRFDYVGLHFSVSSNNKYKYILKNFDKEWVDAGTQRNAVYTNLDPGKYIFRVNAANKDGAWSENGASITIIITPPWWETTYAYILYILVIVSIIYLTWRLQLKRIRTKNEYEMSRFEAEKLIEVDELKSRFFTNISHEFRTPLTLILGPVKQIIERIKDEKNFIDLRKIKSELQVVHKNAKNLLGLVNELLDISKLESGNMKLRTSPQNIVPLLKALVHSFCSYAERKRINLKFTCNEDEIIVYIDKEKIEKIITNLLSNAFKFTPEEGEIEVTVTLQLPLVPPWNQKEEKCHFERAQSEIPISDREIFSKRKISPPTAKIKNKPGRGRNDNIPFASPSLREGIVEISIRDNGIGIPKENFPKIFDRFYQVNGSHTREREGTGIGLSLTKELVELHKGKIEVESVEGKGTTFTVNLPLGKEHLQHEEIYQTEKNEITYDSAQPVLNDEEKIKRTGIEQVLTFEKPILLIVEDNYDVRNYIKDNLKDDYKILEGIDGEDGWNKSLENIPDLIISDVMMPKMDGFELCYKLKTDERTSHIPLILLTAKAAKQDKIEGFETGADEYIMKPFEPDELKARIKNLIEQRKRIHEHFRKNGLFEIEKEQVTPVDHKFIQKAVNVINENIADPDFNVEKFAEKLAIGRSLLNKKFTGLIGEPPVEFIRRIRLTRAAELIEKKFGNISEIALEVGFNNPAYFSDCFKRQFGISPSQYPGHHL